MFWVKTFTWEHLDISLLDFFLIYFSIWLFAIVDANDTSI